MKLQHATRREGELWLAHLDNHSGCLARETLPRQFILIAEPIQP